MLLANATKQDLVALTIFAIIKMEFSSNQKSRIQSLTKKYEVKLVLIFGSHATKKTHQMSDIDIGVLLKENQISFGKYSDLIHEFEKIFPKKKTDLVILNHADPFFLKKIMESAKLIYGEEKDFENLGLYSFHRYQDYKKYLSLEENFVHNFIKTFK